MKSVLIVGYGKMGRTFSLLEKNSMEIYVNDINSERITEARKDGFKTISQKELSFTKFDYVVLALPGPNEQNIVLETVIQKLNHGIKVLDITTSEPDTVNYLSNKLRELSSFYVEIPVLGGPPSIGRWKFLMGGDRELFDEIKEFFSNAGVVHYIGKIGSATKFKLLNNMMTAANALITAEVYSMAKKTGIDLNSFYDIINSSESAGKNEVFDKRLPKLLNGTLEDTFVIELMEKDSFLALSLSRSSHCFTPISSLCHQLSIKALSSGLGNKDIGYIYKIFRSD